MHLRRALMLVSCVLAATGCKKKDSDAPAASSGAPVAQPTTGAGQAPAQPTAGCGPRTITVDGVDLPNLKPGLAVTLKNGVYETEQVELYDTDQITCAEVLALNAPLPTGASSLRAYYHPEAQGLGTEAHTEMGLRGITLGKKAAKVGDTTTICVPAGSTLKPASGSFAGKTVVVSGALEGTYCGLKDLTPKPTTP